MFVIYEYSDAKLIILSFAITIPATFFAEIKSAALQNQKQAAFSNAPKTMFDVGKTMSDVEKIMSDVIQTTSDLFLPLANVWKTKTYIARPIFGQFPTNQPVK